MVDITIDATGTQVQIEVENKVFTHIELLAAIDEIIAKACYSGETITLWKAVNGGMKHLVGEYHSAAKTRG